MNVKRSEPGSNGEFKRRHFMKTSGIKDKVLFVDDEKNLLRSIWRELREEPYEKLFAESGEKALEILEANKISVIVTDLRMPGMDGMELLGIVKRKFPDVIRIIVTASADVSTILSAIHAGETHRYLKKPVKFEEELIPAIKQSLELYKIRIEKQAMVLKIVEYNKVLEKKNKELQEHQQQLLEKKKLEAVLEMAITISHEFSQPLSVILGYTEMLLDSFDENDPDYIKIEKISESGLKMKEIIRKVQSITDYKSAAYVGDLKMVDIETD
jgi:response regulator RpfG family c-di-GMP phosphodiesterase